METNSSPQLAAPTVEAVVRHLIRRKRHRWFSAPDRRCEDGWYGPHKTIEDAARECFINRTSETGERIFVAQGYRMNKEEREEYGVDFDWQVDSLNALEIVLPNASGQGREAYPAPAGSQSGSEDA